MKTARIFYVNLIGYPLCMQLKSISIICGENCQNGKSTS